MTENIPPKPTFVARVGADLRIRLPKNIADFYNIRPGAYVVLKLEEVRFEEVNRI